MRSRASQFLSAVAVLGAAALTTPAATWAAPEDTVCVKPGALFEIRGTGYVGDTVDVRLAPTRVLAVDGVQTLVTSEEGETFADFFPLGVFGLSDGAYSATVKLPEQTTFKGLPIITGLPVGVGSGGQRIPETLPPVQYDVPSATVVVSDGGGTRSTTIKPTIKLSAGFTQELFGWGKKKVYGHFVNSKGKTVISAFLGTSKAAGAYPCGRVISGRNFINLRTELKPGNYRLVYNTNKKKSSGGVRLKAKVTR